MNILEKLESGQRLSYEDGVELYDVDLFTLGMYANKIRRDKYQNKTYFNINRHINPTNICKDVCQFCAYSASRKNPKPYKTGTYKVHSLLRCKNVDCNKYWDRDVNASLNILKIGKIRV